MITATRDDQQATREEFGTLADETSLRRAIEALEANGITVLRARDGAEARRLVLEMVPAGSAVHHGASQSLDVTGISEELDTSGRFDPIGPRAWRSEERRVGK